MWVLSWSTEELIWIWVLLLWSLLVHPKFQAVLRMNCCWPFSKDRGAVLEDFLCSSSTLHFQLILCTYTSRVSHCTLLRLSSIWMLIFTIWYWRTEEFFCFYLTQSLCDWTLGSGFLRILLHGIQTLTCICDRYCKRETFMPLSQCRIYLSNDIGVGSWAWIYFLLLTQE